MSTNKKRYQIGIDIGATKINVGVIDINGRVYHKQKLLLESDPLAENVVNQIKQMVIACMTEMKILENEIDFLGIGVPGTIDQERQIIKYAPNLNWRDFELVNQLKQHFSFDMQLEQDAKSAVIGELLVGAGRGKEDIVCITLGTGIGCGIVINKHVFRGRQNTAGEIGHIVINTEGPACNCGKYGCLEAYASGAGLSKQATRVYGQEISSEQLFELAKQDKLAAGIVDAGVEALGIGIVNIINILSPQMVILSGGLSEQDYYVNKVRKFVYKNAYELSIQSQGFTFCRAALGSDAPMIGAGLLNQIQ